MNDMNMTDHGHDADEQRLAGVIRRGGARARPADVARDAVFAAVRAEWREVVAARARQRRARWSLAAAAAVAGLAVWLAVPLLQAPPAAVAGVVRVTGPVETASAGLWSRFVSARAGGTVAVGDEIRAGAGGRVALQLGDVSLRLDQNSTLAMVAPDKVELRRGAVYVDSGGDRESAGSLVVATPLGDVQHLGTQYEARLLPDSLRVRVREGLVRIEERDGATTAAGAGEQLTLRRDGAVTRMPVNRSGGDWAWAGEIAPLYALENRSLAEFLRWVGRETGRDIEFASSASRAEANRVILRGSTAGLAPERALAAVLSTTRLAASEQANRLFIDFRTDDMR